MKMKRFMIVGIGLSVSLAGAHGVVLAQEGITPAITTNANGDCVTYGTPGNWTISCGDLGPGSGLMVVTPPVTVDTAPLSTDVSPAPAPAPVSDPAPVADPPATTETAVATELDQDADNYADALEPDAGLDPTTADTDADHVADGDELNLYSTNPTLADTDGDGALDGEELFGRHTDPLLWEDGSTSSEPATSSEPVAESAPASAPVETSTAAETTEPVAADTAIGDKEAAYAEGNTAAPLPEGTTENLSATSGGAASMGTGDASAAPGTVTRDGKTTPSLPVPDPAGASSVTEAPPPVSTSKDVPPVVNVSGETTGVSVVPAPGHELAPAAVTEPTTAAEPVEAVETTEPVEGAEPVAADIAVATASDQDADNIADAQEAELGLDASTPDTDADGVADGDEGTLYGTDPLAADTDGDGISDGNELFEARTDPLTAGTNGDGSEDGATAPA
jgi:hypothetical protein